MIYEYCLCRSNSLTIVESFPFSFPCFCFVAKAAWYVRFIFRAHPAFQKNPIPHGYLRLFFTRGVLNGKMQWSEVGESLFLFAFAASPSFGSRGLSRKYVPSCDFGSRRVTVEYKWASWRRHSAKWKKVVGANGSSSPWLLSTCWKGIGDVFGGELNLDTSLHCTVRQCQCFAEAAAFRWFNLY